MYIKIKASFRVGDETISGHTITNQEGNKPQVLFIHGAGESSKERMLSLAVALAEHGIASFSFDFSGHGESTGTLEESSLRKRTIEATAALEYLQGSRPYALCGSSMGGHIALELLKNNNVDNIVLFAPAIYDKDAFVVPFKKGFSEIIRQEKSWTRSDVLEALGQFRGNLLIYIGEKDEVIPTGVIDILDASARNVKRKEIIWVSNLGHQLPIWIDENEVVRDGIAKKIVELLMN